MRAKRESREDLITFFQCKERSEGRQEKCKERKIYLLERNKK
jgi:hypothetical protein